MGCAPWKRLLISLCFWLPIYKMGITILRGQIGRFIGFTELIFDECYKQHWVYRRC